MREERRGSPPANGGDQSPTPTLNGLLQWFLLSVNLAEPQHPTFGQTLVLLLP